MVVGVDEDGIGGRDKEGGVAAASARRMAQRGRGGWRGGIIFGGDEKEGVTVASTRRRA